MTMRTACRSIVLGSLAAALLSACTGADTSADAIASETADATDAPIQFLQSGPSGSPAAPASQTESSFYTLLPARYLPGPLASQSVSIAVGDVSGDGRDDLVFSRSISLPYPANGALEIYVAYQRGDGELDAPVKIGQSNHFLAYQLLVADLSGDGVGEIITATISGIMVLHGNGDGTFTARTAPVPDPWEMLVTDVDRDGHMDILVDGSDIEATVVHGDGQGGILRTSTLPMPASATRALGDVTGDGLDDGVWGRIGVRPRQELRIYPARREGGYGEPIQFSRPKESNHTSSLAVGDFNSDGRMDLALDEARDGADLQLYFQDANGRLGSAVPLARQRGAGVLIARDLDRDGRTDLAMAHSGWGYIGYYLQEPAGLASERVIEAQQFSGRLNYFAAGDLNSDGCTDFAIARSGQPIVLLYGTGCAPNAMKAICDLPPVRLEETVPSAAMWSPVSSQRADVGEIRIDPVRAATLRAPRDLSNR